MTIKELKKELEKYDENQEIKIHTRDFSDYLEDEIYLDDDYAVYTENDIIDIEYDDNDKVVLLKYD